MRRRCCCTPGEPQIPADDCNVCTTRPLLSPILLVGTAFVNRADNCSNCTAANDQVILLSYLHTCRWTYGPVNIFTCTSNGRQVRMYADLLMTNVGDNVTFTALVGLEIFNGSFYVDGGFYTAAITVDKSACGGSHALTKTTSDSVSPGCIASSSTDALSLLI